MSAEKYQFDEVSIAVIEDLFTKLDARAAKEFGDNWKQRRLSSGIARKALYLYIQPDAEKLISDYLHADEPGHKSEDDMDAEMTFDQRTQTKDAEVVFEVERCSDETTAEMFTSYTLRYLSASPLDDIADVPEQIRAKVAKKLQQAEANHIQRIEDGELDPGEEEDFDGTIYFSKQHKYVLTEPQETLHYTVKHEYAVDEYRVPMLRYQPVDELSALSLDRPNPHAPTSTPHEIIGSQQQHDETLAMFEEIMKNQDIEKPQSKLPAEIRVAQIMAILAILDHGEAQNEEQEAIIKDLT